MAAWLVLAAAAQAAAAAPPQPPCAAASYRQLDFWIGRWRVFDTAKGTPVGESRIDTTMNGCAIHESYEAPEAPGGPYSGASYSGFDRKDGKWHQLYVDTNGNVTWYSGGLEGDDMVLTANARGGALVRMTYRKLSGGAVEQVGVVSRDGGKTWSAGYDYTYRPR